MARLYLVKYVTFTKLPYESHFFSGVVDGNRDMVLLPKENYRDLSTLSKFCKVLALEVNGDFAYFESRRKFKGNIKDYLVGIDFNAGFSHCDIRVDFGFHEEHIPWRIDELTSIFGVQEIKKFLQDFYVIKSNDAQLQKININDAKVANVVAPSSAWRSKVLKAVDLSVKCGCGLELANTETIIRNYLDSLHFISSGHRFVGHRKIDDFAVEEELRKYVLPFTRLPYNYENSIEAVFENVGKHLMIADILAFKYNERYYLADGAIPISYDELKDLIAFKEV